MRADRPKQKMVILGVDGMDPAITERLIRDGRLPNFAYLKNKGAYSRLATTTPTETVVAWSTFITGLNPGGHSVFDFVMRDPKNYRLYLGLDGISTINGKPKEERYRKGESFWDILSRHKVPSYIYFCPNTFPARPLYGRMLSGMGVPDISGTIGRFTFYTSRRLSEEDKKSRGRIIPVQVDNGIVRTAIYGPRVSSGAGLKESSLALSLLINTARKEVMIKARGINITLKEGRWSPWQRVSFGVGPFRRAHGMVRFYLKSAGADFALYCSPVNFDPRRPLFPISYPAGLSGHLAAKAGDYYTQGMPHDTWALTENRIGEEAFLELTDEVLRENKELLRLSLKEFKGGVFFYYLETLDIVQHMFWRYLDQSHPLYEKDSPYRDTIFKYYEKIDAILGDIIKAVDADSVIIVLSDHGFSSFRKAVHLNSWLKENGFLYLNPDKKEGGEFLEDIDWSRTRAYALGFGGVYLNLSGREHYGIVKEADAAGLKHELARVIKKLKDPDSSGPVVKEVYLQEQVFNGPYAGQGPDLFVGFSAGYRASWQTALGGVPLSVMENNMRKWSGDHLIDPALVPGVLFTNRKISAQGVSLADIAPTILHLYGIPRSNEMQGDDLFKE